MMGTVLDMKDISTPADSNLAEYQAKLDRLMLEDSPSVFANYSRAHARCIIKTFLSAAKEKVDILAGDFGNDFYRQEDVRGTIEKAVNKGACIRVISLGTSPESKSWVASLAKEVNVSQDGGRARFLYKFARVRSGAQVKHYMIVDGKRYRLEDYHDEGSKLVHAEVCCNGPEKAFFLTRAFDEVWNKLSSPASA